MIQKIQKTLIRSCSCKYQNYAKKITKRESKLIEEEERIGFQHMHVSNLLKELFPPIEENLEKFEESKVTNIFTNQYSEAELILKLFPKPAITFPFDNSISSNKFVPKKYNDKEREEILDFFQKILQKMDAQKE